MASRNFGSQGPVKEHLVRRVSGGLSSEIVDLREDVDVAIELLEEETSGKITSNARIRLNTQPVNTNVVVIGADTYEFNTALPASNAAYIPVVLSGVSVAEDRLRLINAINTQGTEPVVASLVNTDYLQIEPAAGGIAGGFPVEQTEPSLAPDIALAATLAGDAVWSSGNLGRVAQANVKRAVIALTIDAVNVAAAFDIEVPFSPLSARLLAHVDADGAFAETTTSATYVPVPARNAVTVDCTAGEAPPTATDVLYIEVTGI